MKSTGQINNPIKKWTRFFVGLIILVLVVLFFGSGYTPPGVFGEVLRHNQACSIDASPLFYSEVENMADLEEGVRELMESRMTGGGHCKSLDHAKRGSDSQAIHQLP